MEHPQTLRPDYNPSLYGLGLKTNKRCLRGRKPTKAIQNQTVVRHSPFGGHQLPSYTCKCFQFYSFIKYYKQLNVSKMAKTARTTMETNYILPSTVTWHKLNRKTLFMLLLCAITKFLLHLGSVIQESRTK